MMIDWSNDETHLLLNPRMPEDERRRLEQLGSGGLRAHVLMATSGTTGSVKLVALSKQAILASAAAVNERFEATRDDIWCCVLPEFHVGGLGILARAHLTGSQVISMEWDPRAFARSSMTLASLVPAQVHDLIRQGLMPSRRIRAILIGGGIFDRDLMMQARSLGWPVFATYGMSECASTIAVSSVLLEHLQARREADGRLAFRGTSLFTGYLTEEGLVDPKVDGWFVSEDLGDVEGRTLHVMGRRGDFVKIGGESVDVGRLQRILDGVRGDMDAAVIALPDTRLGHVIHLATTGEASNLVGRFNERVLPFERIRAVHKVDSIPRSALGKVATAELARRIADTIALP